MLRLRALELIKRSRPKHFLSPPTSPKIPFETRLEGEAPAVCNPNARPRVRGLAGYLRVYHKLSKLRLSGLVAITTGFGFLVAGSPVNLPVFVATTAGTWLTAASASTFNQIAETSSDARMKRTRLRPLPSGRITRNHAIAFGIATGVAGLSLLSLFTNTLTVALGAGNLLLYTCIYTPMKKITPWNTELGSIVGAIPPIMGWTAATNSMCSMEPFVLSSILFLWQMPHFLSLCWMLKDDYIAGGYKMLSRYDSTGRVTAGSVLFYSGALLPIPVWGTLSGLTSSMFAIDGMCLNAYLVYLSYRFYEDPSYGSARSVFFCSLWHLPLLLAFFSFHKLKQSDDKNITTALELPELHTLGRSLCPHEKLSEMDHTVLASHLCPSAKTNDPIQLSNIVVPAVSREIN